MVSVDRPVLRELAEVLAGLFDRDRGLAIELNRVQRRLLDANDRRALGLARDEVRADVQQAFLEYSFAADKRRQLAAESAEPRDRSAEAAAPAGLPLSPSTVLALQRASGNGAVQRILQRKIDDVLSGVHLSDLLGGESEVKTRVGLEQRQPPDSRSLPVLQY